MKTLDHSLERVHHEIVACNVGRAIDEMEIYLAAWPDAQTSERLNTIKEGYEMMVEYWKKGTADPQRQQTYHRLMNRVYQLFANIAIHRRLQASSFLSEIYKNARKSSREWSLTAIRQEMENFVSEIAMLEFEPEHLRGEKSRKLYQEHQQQMNELFNYVLTSRVWTDGVGKDFTDLLLSPTVDSIDQQLIVSAVMLSSMNQFDIVKFRVLTDVYRDSVDEQVRQRALVGWVFSIEPNMNFAFPEQKEIIHELLKSKRVCQELTELQMQLVYTINAEKDNNTIQREIMPDLIKNSDLQVTRDGIEETEEDRLEEVLHPDASERRMENLEANIQRMMEMQKQGSDIYFGGFSQMKRYPFFYDISNWLVPFFMEHPDISQFVDRMEYRGIIESLLDKGPFCSSDKYSFVIAASEVFNRLPASMREALANNEALMLDEVESSEKKSPAYIRRLYLMDLYRFFRLFPNRAALNNPFEDKYMADGPVNFFHYYLFMNSPLDAYKHDVVHMMVKKGARLMADRVLDFFPEKYQDVQFHLWCGEYEEVLQMDPGNERALTELARSHFAKEEYNEAHDYYDRLWLLHPEKVSYMLNKAVCLVKLGEYDEALKLLYQLDYEHADDINIQRVLAWTLTSDNKLEQAERMYQQLTSSERTTAEDFFNYGFCLWLMNRIEEAAESFMRRLELLGFKKPAGGFFDFNDVAWLKAHGIDDIQICMMETLIKV